MMDLDLPSIMPATISRGRGRWQTIEPWPFLIEGLLAEVPAGFLCDLYSVPWPVSAFIPRDEHDNRPAMIHDWLYATCGLRLDAASEPVFDRFACDRALYITARLCGLPWARCHSLHLGVRLGGWKPWRALLDAGASLATPCLT